MAPIARPTSDPRELSRLAKLKQLAEKVEREKKERREKKKAERTKKNVSLTIVFISGHQLTR